MTSKELWLKRIRNWAGFLGMILPWISLIVAVIVLFLCVMMAMNGVIILLQQSVAYLEL